MTVKKTPVPPPPWESVPRELKEREQWVCWGDKKIPYDARTGAPADSTKRETWSTFQEAVAASGRYNGIGFVFAGDSLVGVDLDHCIAEDGTIDAYAQKIVDELDSYTEISPSGTGLHIFVHGSLPPGGRKKGPVEMYQVGRYFTVTGRHLDGTPLTVEERSAELTALHTRVFAQPKSATPNAPSASDEELDDNDILVRAHRNEKFSKLWFGNITGYPSQSEADLHLCGLLAYYTNRNAAQIDRLFRRSALRRAKWDERHGAQTYGEMTVEKAVAECQGTLLPPSGLQPIATWAATAQQSQDYLVDKLFARGGTSMLVAKVKVGKSTLARHLARCGLVGEPFLGRETKPGTVWYYAFEGNEADFKESFEKLGILNHGGFLFEFTLLPPEHYFDRIVADAVARRPDLIIVDIALKVLPGIRDIRDYMQFSETMKRVADLSHRSGAHVHLLHHAPKVEYGDAGSNAAGATSFAGGVDVTLHLKTVKGNRILTSTGRYGTPLAEDGVWLRHDTATGRITPGDPAEALAHALRDWLAKVREPLTFDEIEKGFSVRRADLWTALRTAEDLRLVWRTGEGKRGKPYRYQILALPLDLPSPRRDTE